VTFTRVQLPAPTTLLAMALVAAGLLVVHLVATHGTGSLDGQALAIASISPSTTLSLWWHHLWAGFFHRSWGHLAYNVAVLLIALPFAVRQQGPLLTLANAYWIGPFTVFTLHLLVVLPLAGAGVPYAVKALEVPLVGFSVMAYSLAGMALTLAPPWVAIAAFGALVLYETALAIWVTAPFIGLYHVMEFAMGFWVRTILMRG
jgi:hypothetical protein